jgi:hypothetical protein
MDIIRVHKSNKNMTETERKAHIRHLANERQKKLYRKKKMEQLKKNEPKITIQKINLDDNDNDIDNQELLIDLLENVTFDNSKDDKERLELIDYLEDELGIEDKLNDSDSDNNSDSDSDSDY